MPAAGPLPQGSWKSEGIILIDMRTIIEVLSTAPVDGLVQLGAMASASVVMIYAGRAGTNICLSIEYHIVIQLSTPSYTLETQQTQPRYVVEQSVIAFAYRISDFHDMETLSTLLVPCEGMLHLLLAWTVGEQTVVGTMIWDAITLMWLLCDSGKPGSVSILRCLLIAIGKPILEIRQSHIRSILTIIFVLSVRQCVYYGIGCWSLANAVWCYVFYDNSFTV